MGMVAPGGAEGAGSALREHRERLRGNPRDGGMDGVGLGQTNGAGTRPTPPSSP